MLKFILGLFPKVLKKWLLNILDKDIANKGNWGDTQLRFLSKGEAYFLKTIGGVGSKNHKTGLPQYLGPAFWIPVVAGVGSFALAKAQGASTGRALLAGGLGALGGYGLQAFGGAGSFLGGAEGLSNAAMIGGGITAGSIGAAAFAPQQKFAESGMQSGQPFSPEQYALSQSKADEQAEGLGDRFDYSQPGYVSGQYYSPPEQQQVQEASVYDFNQPDMYRAKEGGLAEIVRFKNGGINYLPSKMDHDENDLNNYIRAEGYVEDGSGNGDKDEDTMLAQLADGEFVSRADAILGAGIMSGASPKDFKDMRRKGAQFFYNQQDQLKRIYDIVADGNKKD
tara:strand:+ start:956 stop:1969 length:1014 start_codon:yes stop_codon:yes gene_type:complete